ncbi:hypothetical protein SDC9_140791 [bioreactor metagenome]|uniref:Uncharacterized protein n=1 Tax=bioreactor metagenome TaxID=1076179 RepID=A0A645DWF7_9ZZZZ
MQGHVPNLVQKDGTAVGQLELSHFSFPVCAGEGSSFIAEQLAFQQIGRYGRAVYLDKASVYAVADLVYGVGEQFLAGAAFSHDQYAGIGHARLPCNPLCLQQLAVASDDIRKGVFGAVLARHLLLIAFQLFLHKFSVKIVELLDISEQHLAHGALDFPVFNDGLPVCQDAPASDLLQLGLLSLAGARHDMEPGVLNHLRDGLSDHSSVVHLKNRRMAC